MRDLAIGFRDHRGRVSSRRAVPPGRSRARLLRRTKGSAQNPRFRPVLDQFAPYQPGKPSLTPDGRSFKLSSNEAPFGPLPSVLKIITEAAGGVNRYPDNGAAELTEAIAGRFGVPA